MRAGWKTRFDERVYFENKKKENSARILQLRMADKQRLLALEDERRRACGWSYPGYYDYYTR